MRQDIQAMQVFIDTMLGRPKFSYPAKKNAPRPTTEFASVQLIEQYVEGLPHKRLIEEVLNVDNVVVAYRYEYNAAVRLRFRVTVVNGDGLASTVISNAWTSEAMKELMKVVGYGYVRSSPISLEDAQLEKNWEARDGLSIELYTTRTYIETVDRLQHVLDVTGLISNGIDEILVSIDINN